MSQGTYRYHRVEQQVMNMLDEGRFSPGEKLPSLRSLSTSMHVSLATVTHAYLELERKGIIEARPRSGYFVREVAPKLPIPSAPPKTISEPEDVTHNQLIRTVLNSVVGRKDLVPFGCVCPDDSLLPGKALSRIMNEVMRVSPHAALGYETIQGNHELRKEIAWRSQESGIAAGSQHVLCTAGAMEAIYIALRCLTRPGDTVVVQSPTYFCFMQLLETLGLRVIELASHPEYGILPEELQELVTKYSVAACILSPNFNNPDGALIPEQQKTEIVQILTKRNIQLIEDDVSGELQFSGARPTPLKCYDTKGMVTLCSSFSKTVAPGYRAGWMLPGRILEKALKIKATTNVCAPTPTQMALAEYLRYGNYNRHITRLRAAFSRQMDTVRHHLATHFPVGTRVTRPQGGSVLWVQLPQSVNGTELFFKALEAGISIAPGAIFTTGSSFQEYIRLSCCGVWSESMESAICQLGKMAKQMCIK